MIRFAYPGGAAYRSLSPLRSGSTRRVTKILQELCGLEITSTQVSRAVAELDTMLEAWRNRLIPPVSHLILDARYEKVRVGLTAIGIRKHDGKSSILGVSVSLPEAEVHWREFLSSLQARGLHTCSSITSDAHEGLKAATTSVYPGVPWNRCQFHLEQNAQACVPRPNHKEQVAADPPRHLQRRGFTPRPSQTCRHRGKIRRRRSRVASTFPNPESCLRLVSAILLEISEQWEEPKAYLNPQLLA